MLRLLDRLEPNGNGPTDDLTGLFVLGSNPHSGENEYTREHGFFLLWPRFREQFN